MYRVLATCDRWRKIGSKTPGFPTILPCLAAAVLLWPAGFAGRIPLTLPPTAAVTSSSDNREIQPRRPHSKHTAAALSARGFSARIVVKFHEGTGVRLTPRVNGSVDLEVDDPRSEAQSALSAHSDRANPSEEENASRGKSHGRLVVAPGYPKITNPSVPRLSRKDVALDLRRVEAITDRDCLVIDRLVDEHAEELGRWKERADQYWGKEVADLTLYYQLVMPDWGRGTDTSQIVQKLNRLRSVEIAYAEPLAFPDAAAFDDQVAAPPDPVLTCTLDLTTPDFEGAQGYLSAAPVGVDAFSAWSESGGRGEGLRIVDIEAAYGDHGDHPGLGYLVGHYYHNDVSTYRRHGNAVVGVLAALNNGVGITGIASDASVLFRSIFNQNLFDDWAAANSDSQNVASNIYWAAKHSLEGVVLIELQRPGPEDEDCLCGNTCIATPVEFWPADFDQIEAATGNGVVVIEPAANGGHDLDSAVFLGLFDRDIRDSGAVLTTGSEPETRVPLCSVGSPNTGSRVDVHSWGGDIVSAVDNSPLLHDNGWCNSYTEDFGGSSGASAIVAGVAASLQGVALANLGMKLDPLTLRQILVNTGTPQAPGPNGELIGPQPNLQAAIEEILP